MSHPKETDLVVYEGVSFNHSEVFSVVDRFYRKVASDHILSVPFSTVSDWPDHIEKMTNFWWMKLGGKNYLSKRYSPISKHYNAGFNDDFLERWLKLFVETLNEVGITERKIELWEAMARRIGKFLTKKNQNFGMDLANDPPVKESRNSSI